MSWWNPFAKAKAQSPVLRTNRRRVSGSGVAALLRTALAGCLAANYRHIEQKRMMAICDMDTLEACAKAAHQPWKADVWECEDIARAALVKLQQHGANEGCTFAAGTLRALSQESQGDIEATLHVYLWCLVEKPGTRLTPESRVMFYDPTALRWVETKDLEEVDYTLT